MLSYPTSSARRGPAPLLLVALVALGGYTLPGCAGGGGRGDGGAGSCMTDLDCDDMHACTLDSCRVDMTCRHDPINERCDMGLTCEVGRGCVSTSSCTTDEDCADAHECTIDSCGVGGLCGHTPVNERCTTAGQTCDIEMGCVTPPGCDSAAECNDDVACTMDSCGADRMCTNTPLHELCDMAAGERCAPTVGCLAPIDCTIDADCADQGDFCDGTWVCDPEFGCEAPAAPRMCDDSDPCTVDACDSTADMCTFTCDSSRPECGCPMTGPSCTGRFRITPAISENCVSGMVVYDISTVEFIRAGGVLQVMPASSHFGGLSDATEPVCPMFTATATVSGGTTETFTLTGTFSDDDNFSGTWASSLGGVGSLLGCLYEGTTPVTGTRIP